MHWSALHAHPLTWACHVAVSAVADHAAAAKTIAFLNARGASVCFEATCAPPAHKDWFKKGKCVVHCGRENICAVLSRHAILHVSNVLDFEAICCGRSLLHNLGFHQAAGPCQGKPYLLHASAS